VGRLLLYFLGGLLALIGAAWFLRGSISLRKRDEYAIKNSVDDAIAHQTLSQIHQNQHHQNPF
jgi:hypothetical protein